MAAMWSTLVLTLLCSYLPSNQQFGIPNFRKLSPCHFGGHTCQESPCGSTMRGIEYTCPNGETCCEDIPVIPCSSTCTNGDCVDDGTGMSQCLCRAGFSGNNCELNGNCAFSYDTCGWSNSNAGDFNWTFISGATPSELTGPVADHTVGTCNGSYLYTETSVGQRGNNSIIQSISFPPSTDQCITFYYYMFGADTGTLNVLVTPQNESPHLLWSVSGEQGQSWLKGVVAIPQQTTNYQIYIEGIWGDVFGDIAIDGISFHPCTQTLQNANISPGNCDFDAGTICDWTNLASADFEWTLNSGPTPTSHTGPTSDNCQITANYMYMESSPLDVGDAAIFLSPVFQSSGGQCMSFYYHMYGSVIGTLSVLVQPLNQSPQVLWSLSGDQGQTWLQGVVAIPQQTTEYQVLIRGVHGSGPKNWEGDISIDDISFSNLCSCTQTPPTAAVTADVPACANSGGCVAATAETLSYICNCPAGFTGDRCETVA